ncbi:MAG: class I adenylate-forming enzyme family protein [Actinomycetota bacterium]
MTSTTPGAPELVGLRLPRADLPSALEEVWGAGNAVLPLDPIMPPSALEGLVDRLRPARLVDAAGERPLAGEPLPPGTALVIPTSGSSGPAHGVELSHAALRASATATIERLGLSPEDGWLCALPLHHIAGLQVVLRARLLGAPLEIHERLDARVVGDCRAAVVFLVPTQLRDLLVAGADLARFKVILLGGAAASPDLLDRARRAGANIVRTYGMTETCGGCVYDGIPLDGVEVRVGEGGEVLVRGPMIFTGYRGRPDLTAASFEEGWLRTLDVGELDGDGRLRVLGRADEIINTGGEKVSPVQVADLLAEHPRVGQVEVVGVPDDRWGERVVAVVLPRGHPPDLAELRNLVAARAPGHLAPKQLLLIASMPLLPSGKVDRAALSRLAGGSD